MKQAGRLWSHLLHEKLSDAGFKQSLTDSCLYYDQDTKGITVLGVYVDDILITRTSFSRNESTFDSISSLLSIISDPSASSWECELGTAKKTDTLCIKTVHMRIDNENGS